MRFIAMFVTAVCVLFHLSYDDQRKRIFTIVSSNRWTTAKQGFHDLFERA